MEKQNNNVDKLTDKAFSRSVIIAVVSIVLCIVCLSSATFAWFTTTTTSSQNVVSGGFFGLVVIVTGMERVWLPLESVSVPLGTETT